MLIVETNVNLISAVSPIREWGLWITASEVRKNVILSREQWSQDGTTFLLSIWEGKTIVIFSIAIVVMGQR